LEQKKVQKESVQRMNETKIKEKKAMRKMLDHEVEFIRFQKESKIQISKMEKEINEKARAVPVLHWVEKELKLNKGTDDDSGKKQRTKKLLKKLRMELLVGRKVMEFSLRDTRMDVETKEKTLRSKFEPYAKGRAAAERDVKIARIENIRANTRVKAINKVLKQLVAKYIESKKSVENIGSNMYESNKNISSNTNEA
jgi:hypothetical protein